MKRSGRYRRGVALLLLLSAVSCAHPESTPSVKTLAAPKRLLLFTKSSGFEHDIVKASANGGPSFVETQIVRLAASQNWQVTHSKDGTLFTNEGLAPFDAFILYCNGDLTKPGTDGTPPFPTDGKAALLHQIALGKGVVGIHAPTDAFHSPGDRFEHNEDDRDAFPSMLGGEFIRHGEQQRATVRVTDPSFPGMTGTAQSIEILEEWYTFKNLTGDLHAILVLDTETMRGGDYGRPNFPVSWTRQHGKGRVFYTALGHREDVWESSFFQNHLTGAIAWALGQVQADTSANLETVAPEVNVLQANPAKLNP
jgi:uncharacterized protein